MVGAKGFEPSTLWSQTLTTLSDLFQINDLRTPKLLEVAHWCLWMQTELAQKSRRPCRRQTRTVHASVRSRFLQSDLSFRSLRNCVACIRRLWTRQTELRPVARADWKGPSGARFDLRGGLHGRSASIRLHWLGWSSRLDRSGKFPPDSTSIPVHLYSTMCQVPKSRLNGSEAATET